MTRLGTTNLTLTERVATGIDGLDETLHGGLLRGRLYLVSGGPGTGKTTLALQFLLEGVRRGERGLFFTALQTRSVLERVAASHGWDLAGITIIELGPALEAQQRAADQTVFHPAEVELGETTEVIMRAVEEYRPDRLVIDALSEVQYMSPSPTRFRRQIVAFRQLTARYPCTVLLTIGAALEEYEYGLQTVVDGILLLEQIDPVYGPERRRMLIRKVRAAEYEGGYHDFRIRTGGLEVFPRLENRGPCDRPLQTVASGVAALDALLGGGLEKGTTCLIAGTTGTGKSALATLYAHSAVARGERSAIYLFDERLETFHTRSTGLGMDLRQDVEKGLIAIREMAVGEVSAGELARDIRRQVEDRSARIIVIDSLSGYLNALPEEKLLVAQLHELSAWLGCRGVLTVLTVTEHGFLHPETVSGMDVSYLTDTVLVLRYFEAFGQIRKAISVPKKRYGVHETTIRELKLGKDGVTVGKPLDEFAGVLTGVPRYAGKRGTLMKANGFNSASPK